MTKAKFKKFFGVFNLCEYIFLFVFAAAGIVIGIVTGDIWLGFICLVAGLFCEMLLAKRNRSNFVFSIINDICCGIIAIQEKFILDIAMNFGFWVPNDIISMPIWYKNKEKEQKLLTNVRKLKWWHFLIVYVSLFALAWPISLLLELMDGNQVYLDALSALFEISTGILIMLRFKNHYYIWLTAVLIQSVKYGLEGQWLIVLLQVGYLLIALYGYFNWEKNIKKQEQTKATDFVTESNTK